jgi:hypothetical protein
MTRNQKWIDEVYEGAQLEAVNAKQAGTIKYLRRVVAQLRKQLDEALHSRRCAKCACKNQPDTSVQ